jgi:amino acid transporter
VGDSQPSGLQRHLGLLQATAVNVTMVVGAGVFVTIPDMLGKLPGPYALLGWLAAGALILVDSLVWSELGAAFPGSGGSYVYLLECYGPNRWGRLMAFLFIWQFLLSGPLEIASGLIAMDTLAQPLSGRLREYNQEHAKEWVLWKDGDQEIKATVSPTRLACVALGAFCIALLYRRVTSLGWLAVFFWFGILAAIFWILVEGCLVFDAARAFDFGREAAVRPERFAFKLGGTMMLALYSYLGYYNVCNLGAEVRDPGRTIPRSILLSTALVIVLFVALHLAMLGAVHWQAVVSPEGKNLLDADGKNLPFAFMEGARGHRAAQVLTVLILGSCFASIFSGLLGYSRIPYGAACAGHFFSAVGRVHPVHHIPHVSLFLVGGLTLAWSFFDFGSVVSALITTRLLVQFVAQITGLMLLRRARPHGPWPFRMWLYPLPCALALAGWLYVFGTSGSFFIAVSVATLMAGLAAYFLRSAATRSWPFGTAPKV